MSARERGLPETEVLAGPIALLRQLAGHPVANALALAAIPLLSSCVILLGTHHTGVFGFDFRGTLWDPAKAILSGHTPYPPPHPEALRTGNPAVYPPPAMLLVTPLRLLPWAAGLAIWLIVEALAAAGALRLLGVRDPRVYVAALASAPVVVGFIFGNVTLLLLFGAAAAWRWRNAPRVLGPIVGALMVAKIFLWPLLVWLVVTRRYRSATYAVAYAVLAAVGSWAVIGFDGLRQYPALLRALERVYVPHSESMSSLLVVLGAPERVATALALLVGVSILGVGVVLSRRRDGDRRMYTAAIVAAIIASPIAWLYYYVLLLAPLALYQASAGPVWWSMSVFWPALIAEGLAAGRIPCCKPPGMPKPVWQTLSTTFSAPYLVSVVGTCLLIWLVTFRPRPAEVAIPPTRTFLLGELPIREWRKPARCPEHGAVDAVREVPVFVPPGFVWAARRAMSSVRGYRCPNCGARAS